MTDSLGYYDADGAEWEGPVDEMLAAKGYARTGGWKEPDGASGAAIAPAHSL